jgi:hypothetical protein
MTIFVMVMKGGAEMKKSYEKPVFDKTAKLQVIAALAYSGPPF